MKDDWIGGTRDIHSCCGGWRSMGHRAGCHTAPPEKERGHNGATENTGSASSDAAVRPAVS